MKNGTKKLKTTTLTVDEFQDATIVWTKKAQETNFLNIHENNGKRSSKVRQLRLYKDENKILKMWRTDR